MVILIIREWRLIFYWFPAGLKFEWGAGGGGRVTDIFYVLGGSTVCIDRRINPTQKV